jgi:DNA invertase Pin-like site-specific DNA recombinase
MPTRERAISQLDGYVRVSRVAGREGESFISPRVQEEKIRAWARLHDVEIGEIVEELDVSGGTPPEERRLETLLRRCEQGTSQGIITWRIDRFSRNALDTLTAAQRLKVCGARLVGVDDGVDTATPGGQLILTVLAGLAEEQRDRAREGWRVARSEASKRGVYLSGHSPTGYLRAEGGGLIPDPATAPTIREAFKARADGASFPRVADLLEKAGVLPRAGLRRDGVTRVRWSREGVRGLLRNPLYCGRPQGANQRAQVEPIVSPEEFRAAQIPVAVYPTGNGRTRALLVGLIKCGGCGHGLHGSGRPTSYVCRGRFASGPCPARAAANAERVDAYVLAAMQQPEVAEMIAKASAGAESRYLAALEAVERADAELDAWVADVTLRSRLGDERFRRGIEARADDLDEARHVLAATPDPGIPEDATVVHVGGQPQVYEMWNEMPIERKRQQLRRVIESVVLHRADPERRRHQPIGERVEIRWVGEPDT